MKRMIGISAVSLITFSMILSTLFSQTRTNTTSHSEWVAKSLSEIQTVKVGMTRRDLLKVFTIEGGVSNRTTRTYVFRECPYIKVDVGFEPVGAPKDKLNEQMEDKIIRISRPYLAQIALD